MIIIEGSVTAAPEHIDALVGLAIDHVQRSRLEPGCLSHAVARDAEDPLRLVFTEHWVDLNAVRLHFAVPASGQFVRTAAAMSSRPPTLSLFEAAATSV